MTLTFTLFASKTKTFLWMIQTRSTTFHFFVTAYPLFREICALFEIHHKSTSDAKNCWLPLVEEKPINSSALVLMSVNHNMSCLINLRSIKVLQYRQHSLYSNAIVQNIFIISWQNYVHSTIHYFLYAN